ncbi:MAG: ABC transporter permease [Eggerthellaceae bacterium]|nr:ABC transporter permease [Eggerthellaceae bacterium]
MRANAPEGVDVQALLPAVQRAVANGVDPRQMVATVRGAIAAGADPEQLLAMQTMGAGAEPSSAVPSTTSPEASRLRTISGGASEGQGSSGNQDAYASARKRLKRAGIIAFWLVVWEVLDRLVDNRLVLAGPIRTVQALVEQIAKPDFWVVCGASFGRIALGFLLSFAAGILLALIAHRFRTFRDFVEPIVSLLRTVPVVTFIILLLIWMGNQWLTVFLAFFIVLPIVYTNMIAGFESVDAHMLEMARVHRLSRWRTFAYIYRPAFMPFLVSACKLSLGMSWKSGIMAEVLATPKPSIGKEMANARQFLDTPDLFAWTVVVMVLSWLFEKAVSYLLRRAARPAGSLLGKRGA